MNTSNRPSAQVRGQGRQPLASALSHRFSPDMKRRWMPTIDGKIISAGGVVPFSGFATRREALAVAKQVIERCT